MSRRQISLMSMTNHALGLRTCTQAAWQFRVISPRRCICKIPWPNGISELDRSEQKFAQRLAAKGKGEKFWHRAEDWRKFSAGDNWVLFKKRRLLFSTHACHGRPWGQRGMKWRDARNSHPEQESSSVSEVKKQTDVKILNSIKASPATRATNFLSIVGKMKSIVVWLSTSSRVSWLQVWKNNAFMAVVAFFRHADGERKPQREVEKKVLKEQLLFWKKGPRLWSNKCYSTESWRIGIERFGGTHLKLSGCTWYKIEVGKEKGILEALSKKVNLMSEILARLFLRRNHQRKPHDKQVVSAK